MQICVVTPRMGGKEKCCSQNQSCMTQFLNASNLMFTGPFDICHI